MAGYIRAGKIAATHGVKGELIFRHNLGKKTSLKGLQAIFFEEKKGAFLPWFIEKTTLRNENEVLIKLEKIETREAALKLVQKEVWLNEDDLIKFASKSSPVSLLGYNIINNNEILGEVLEIIEQPHQLLCRLEIKNKEVFIPLHEESLKKIDHKKKELQVELPDGLLDIYLG